MIRFARDGFTLIELLIVIAIIGALAVITLVNFSGSRSRAVDAERQSDVKQYQAALETYANHTGGVYPIRAATVNIFSSLCGSGHELAAVPCQDDPDPAKDYKYISDTSGLDYVLWAQLERSGEYFVLCATGETGQVAPEPVSANCPL